MTHMPGSDEHYVLRHSGGPRAFLHQAREARKPIVAVAGGLLPISVIFSRMWSAALFVSAGAVITVLLELRRTRKILSRNSPDPRPRFDLRSRSDESAQ